MLANKRRRRGGPARRIVFGAVLPPDLAGPVVAGRWSIFLHPVNARIIAARASGHSPLPSDCLEYL